jgi:hypothetical protein
MVLVMNSLQTVSFTSALQKLIEFFIPKLSVVFHSLSLADLVDPVDKNLILDEQSQIEDALQQYFSNIGNHANNMQDVDNFKDNVLKYCCKASSI